MAAQTGGNAELQAGQAVIIERIDNMKTDVREKHIQNRKDIHDIRAQLEELFGELWKLKLKIAFYSGAGSVIGAIVGVVASKIFEALVHHN
jgi:hypothetical protein